MDECVHSGTPNLSPSQSVLSLEPATDLGAYVAEVEWRRRWADICTGRESGGKMDDRWGQNSTQVRSDEWVMGGARVKCDGQVRSASRTVVPGDCVDDLGCV